jgi:hypothetical protein
MRMFTNSPGPTYIYSFLRRIPLAILLGGVSLLSVPSPATAQVWVSSGFNSGPDPQHETAYCSTSAVNPQTGAASAAATDYQYFIAACTVTASTGATISSSYCPMNVETDQMFSTGYPYIGTPTGTCAITFKVRHGVVYTVNAIHALDLAYYNYCEDLEMCFIDPEGLVYLPQTAPPPAYAVEGASIAQELQGTGTAQVFSGAAADSPLLSFGAALIATSSAVFPALIVQAQDVTPSPNLQPEQALLGVPPFPTAHLTLGGTFQIGLGYKNAAGTFRPLPSGFSLGSPSLSGNLDSNALFAGNAVFQFTDQVDNKVVLQGVHLGTQQITITPNDTTIPPVSITLSVEDPQSLGGSHGDLDSMLYPLADDTGVPPQMIKGQVATEGGFDPMAWRYEPLNGGVGDFAVSNDPKDLRIQNPYNSLNLPTIGDGVNPSDCGKRYDYAAHVDSRIPDPNCVGLAQGATFSQQVMGDIAQTHFTIVIPERNPNTGAELLGGNGQPLTRPLTASDRYVSVRDIYDSNDGVYHWSRHGNPNAVAQLENGTVDFSAQLSLASSYGLLQVTYAKAIESWTGNTGSCGPTDLMDPDNLFDTTCNLYNGGGSLGVGTRITEKSFASNNSTSPSVTGEPAFERLFLNAYQKYDPGEPGYGNSVITNTKRFEPGPTGNIFTTGGQQ